MIQFYPKQNLKENRKELMKDVNSIEGKNYINMSILREQTMKEIILMPEMNKRINCNNRFYTRIKPKPNKTHMQCRFQQVIQPLFIVASPSI